MSNWIDVNDRLPNRKGDFLVTYVWHGWCSGTQTLVGSMHFNPYDKKWNTRAEVVAWQELPEPYYRLSEVLKYHVKHSDPDTLPTEKQLKFARIICSKCLVPAKEIEALSVPDNYNKEYYRQFITKYYDEFNERCYGRSYTKTKSGSNYYGDCDAIYADAIDYFGDASMYY